MKKGTLCSVALAALIGLGAFAPAVQAAENTHKGSGKIGYTQGNTTPTVTPPEKEGPEITEPEVNPVTDPLMIIAISPLDFETHDLDAFTTSQDYYAKDFTTTEKESGAPITMENFVKFRDIRGTDNHKYQIQAKLTQQFTSGSSVIKGAELEYTNLRLGTTDGNLANLPTTTGATPEAVLASSVALAPAADGIAEGAAQTVLTNNSAEKGFGVYDIIFGTMGAGDTTDSTKSVKLTVPGNTPLQVGEYAAEITWSITDTF